jgi:hypothetical protein
MRGRPGAAGHQPGMEGIVKEDKMTFAQRLTRKRPKLMRKWKEDKAAKCILQVDNDIDSRAVVMVRLEFSNGRIEEIEMPLS